MAAYDYVTAIVFGLWFTLSIPGQFESRLARRIRRKDIFGLIPTWTFFAPNPGTSDYHLIYRDFENEVLGAWKEIPFVFGRTWYNWLWNPLKRRSKVLSDCVSSIGRSIRDSDQDQAKIAAGLPLTVPYMLLLNSVIQKDDANIARSFDLLRQFAIVERRPRQGKDIEVMVCSPFHTVAYASGNPLQGAPDESESGATHYAPDA